MTLEQHTKVFNAYLARLQATDIAKIKQEIDACWYAAMNLGNSSQIVAQQKQYEVVQMVLTNMIEHDRDNIEKIIHQNLE
jgi:hypothetical protein